MAILTASDKDVYFPTVFLTGAELDMAIALTQSLVEGAIKRPLEWQQYHETKRLSKSFDACQLLYTPIVLSPAPTVEGRFGGGLNGSYRKVAAGEWRSLSPTEYAIDRSGRFELKASGLSYSITEIRISYFSGVISALNSAELRRLKAALGAALSYTQSDQFEGIVSHQVDKEYSISYGGRSGAKAGQAGVLPDSYIDPFRRYQPGRYQPIWNDAIDPSDPTNESAEIDETCYAGQVLYVKNGGHLGLARADALGTATIAGLALSDAAAQTSAVYSPDGVIELSNWTAATGAALLSPGESYFLSPDSAGMMTAIAPTAGGQFVSPVGLALSETRFSVELSPLIAL